MNRIAIYCGAYEGERPAYRAAAEAMGRELAARGIGLVYGGGKVGLMGAVADSALAAGGQVIGVMPRALVEREIAHGELTELHVVDTMSERKGMMITLADAYIALPGGFGTLEEYIEVLNLAQLSYHRKPAALLNIEGFYDPLIALFDHFMTEGFVRAPQRELVLVESSPAALLDRLATYDPPVMKKW